MQFKYVSFFLWGLVIASLLLASWNISWIKEERCVGPAFLKQNKENYSSGKGKCEIREQLQFTLFNPKYRLYGHHRSFQGQFQKGKMMSGQYVEWEGYNYIEYSQYQSDDRVEFDGKFNAYGQREGFGLFTINRKGDFSTKFIGFWRNGSFSTTSDFSKDIGTLQSSPSNNLLEYSKDRHTPEEIALYPKYLLTAIQYSGQVMNGLANGKGSLRMMNGYNPIANFSVISGEWINGTLRKVESIRLADGISVSIVDFQDRSGSLKATFFIDNDSTPIYYSERKGLHCEQKKVFIDATIRNLSRKRNAMIVYHPSVNTTYTEMFEIMEALSLWERTFLSMAPLEEQYYFNTFEMIAHKKLMKVEL